MPICNGRRGSPTWFGRTAGGWVRSARRAAACATSHSRAATGPFGRRAGSLVFAALTAPTEARGGSLGGFMPDLKSLGSLSGEWFYLLIVEEPTKTALRLGENISACGVGMPRADGPQASPVRLVTPTALKPKPPAAVRLIRILLYAGNPRLGGAYD